jgi:hypothetical protein
MKRKIILVIAVLIGLFFASSVYAEGIDEFTKLMIHSDTFDGDTNFVDGSLTGHSISGNGGVAHTTTQYQFPASSIFFDGIDDYLAIPDSVDWTWGSADFTVDFWVRFSSTGGYQGLLLSQVSSTQYFRSAFFNNYLRWDTYSVDYMWSWVPSIDTWYHIAFVRHSGIIRAYVNGNEIGSGQSDSVYYDATNGLYFGRDHDTYPVSNHFLGYIDELRISKGIARWTSDFTPPSAPYRDHFHPIANAGPDQVVFDEVTLDGSGSSDPDGTIVLYDWELQHREDSIPDITASGMDPTISGLTPGLYDVGLTVTDEDGLTDTDTMLLGAAGSCEPASECHGDFDGDGNVDGSDLVLFATDFGRTDCLTDD